MASHAYTHKISGSRHDNLRACSMKGIQYWAHMSTLTTDGNYIKNFFQSFHKQRGEGEGAEEERQQQKWKLQGCLCYTETHKEGQLQSFCVTDKYNKHDHYRGKNCVKKFCKDLKEDTVKIINYEKKEIASLTSKEHE